MASLRKRGKTWYFAYVDADGRRIERKGCTDKRATEDLARAAESEAAKIKAGLVDPRDLARKDHAARPIAEHLEAYRAHLTAKGATPKHIALMASQARRVFSLAAASRLSDLTADRVQDALKALREDGLSLGTVNSHRTAARAFSAWAWKSGRLASNPLANVTGYNAKEDRRHDRRTIGVDELRHLIETARTGPTWRNTTGPERALCYRLAVATGLRYGEIQSIRPESFDWRADPPTVIVAAGYTKNGEPAAMILPDDLASDLRPYVASVAAGEAVFRLTDDRGASMLRADLERAGIPYRDAGGLVFDFHSLRCQTATLLDAAGVSPRVAQRLMRHSTPGLTDRYTKPRAVDMERAALSLPALRTDPDLPEASSLAATGTDVQPISKVFAAHLPRAEDGMSRIPSETDGTTTDDGKSGEVGFAREKTESDGPGRPVTDSVGSAPRWTRTINPLIKSQLLCQLS